MLTLEVNGQFVTWPEQFAEYMMHYYRSHGVSFVVHRDCVHAHRSIPDGNDSTRGKRVRVGAFEYACCYQ